MTKSRCRHGTRLPSLDHMTTPRVALVTGANQGIGYALVADLAARWRPDDLILLTGRNESRVAEAATRTAATSTGARVQGMHLDVTDAGAVARTAAALTGEYGGIDVV